MTKIFATRNALVLMTCLSGVGYAEARAVHKHQTHPRIMQGHSVVSKIQTPINSSKAIVRKQPVTAISATSDESVSVSAHHSRGGGMMRVETAPYAVQTVTKQYIEMKSPTGTALDYIQNLPSISVSTTDTSGIQGGQIQNRGLTDSDMGLLIDGAPAQNATYLTEDIDSENLDSVSILPGSTPVDVPATAAAGGVMNEVTHDPSHKFGGMTDFSYGTNNLSREFLRLESGDIGNTGVRSFLSFSNTHARTWVGAGINNRRHLDFGMRKDWQNGSFARFFLSWNNEDSVVNNYPTASQFYTFKHTGQSYGHTAGFDAKNNDYWKNNLDIWNEIFLTAPIHAVVNDKLSFDLKPYYNWGRGWDGGPNGTASAGEYTYRDGTAIAAGTPLTSYYNQTLSMNVGVTAQGNYDIDRHNHLTFGYWYQNSNSIAYFPVSVTKANGVNPHPDNLNYAVYSDGVRSNYGSNSGSETHALFIQNTAKYLNDKLQIDAGFKFVMSNIWTMSAATHSNAHGENITAPLPHFSISYHFNSHHQIYINAEGDFRQPSASALSVGASSGTMPKNQYSIKEELGYRYNDKYINLDLDLFNYNITNRLLSTYLGNGESGVVNAGNQTIRGFDIMLAAQSYHGISPYVSFEYLNARMDTNIAASDVYGNLTAFRTKGRQAPMAPHVMANLGVTYTYKGFFSNATLHYTGPQSVTLAGDQRIPGYITNSLTLGYHFKPMGFAKTPTIRLNFTNLTGSIVRSGAEGVGTNINAVRLMNGNLSATGTGAQFYLVPRFSMTGTISTSF